MGHRCVLVLSRSLQSYVSISHILQPHPASILGERLQRGVRCDYASLLGAENSNTCWEKKLEVKQEYDKQLQHEFEVTSLD